MGTARQTIERAFLAAHLLTANACLAEDLTIQAIEAWNPPEEPPEVLFGNVLKAALRASASGSSEANVPEGLGAVVLLAPKLRRCFVLRILVGWSAEMCSQMLDIGLDEIDRNTHAALQTFRSARKSEIMYAA